MAAEPAQDAMPRPGAPAVAAVGTLRSGGTVPHHLVQGVRTALLLLVLCATALTLVLALGRGGERMATLFCVNVCAVVALGVYSGNSGNVSFGHAAFMGFGAYLSGLLTLPLAIERSALPELPSILAAPELGLWASLAVVGGAGALAALLTGLAVARLEGAAAAIATLGLLIIAQTLLLGAREVTRGAQTFYGVPLLTTLPVALGTALAFVTLARLFREGRPGLALRAVRDDAAAAAALGIDPVEARLWGWVLSGAMAAVAGALYGHFLGAFSPRDFHFALTFALVAMLVVGGLGAVGGGVVGVLAVTVVQEAASRLEAGFALGPFEVPELFGLPTAALGLMILLAIRLRPQGLVGGDELRLPALEARLPRRPAAVPPIRPAAARAIEAEGLTRRFDGVTAVDGVTLTVPAGGVTGLIGPNGAGKSTLVNLLSSQDRADAGRVRFGGDDLADLAPWRAARRGLTRTFQNNRLFEGLTVVENVAVAAMATGARGRAARARAWREVAAMGLEAWAETRAGALPYGARKRLEIARCLATEPSMILLDEPAAGMNAGERADLAERLAALVRGRGLGVLLIDHDLDLVHRLSKVVCVLNRGRVIAVGTPAEIRADPAVIEAYIGGGSPVPPGPNQQGVVA